LTALRDNHIAAAEGSAGAPKYALKSVIGSRTGAGNIDFNSIGAWSGVWFTFSTYNVSGISTRALYFDATDDGGSTYLGAVALYTLPITSDSVITGFFDFATGLVHGTISGAGATTFSQTIAGASTAIDGVRFIGNTDVNCGVLIHPNGGESAT